MMASFSAPLLASTKTRSFALVGYRLNFQVVRFFCDKRVKDSGASSEEELNSTTTLDSAGKVEEDSSSSYQKALEEIETAELSARQLHGDLLRKYASAENKRRERSTEISKRNAQNIKAFASKSSLIFDSLGRVCELAQAKAKAPGVDEKVKSLAEGLTMTHGIMNNILEKHNISNSRT